MYGFAKGGQTDRQVSSQVHASRKEAVNFMYIQLTCDELELTCDELELTCVGWKNDERLELTCMRI